MPNRIASSGRYSPENTVAYMSGNAANIAPPAVISQTSLPSQTGPMVLSTARCVLFAVALGDAAEGAISMPTPKSKPSSTKKPTKSTAMQMNQKFLQSHRDPSSQYANDRGASSSSPGGFGGAGSESCSSGPSTT